MDEIDEAPRLQLSISFDHKTNLFLARLDNGARFNFSPANVSGKLGANLDLLRDFTLRNAKGEPPHPHSSMAKRDPDAELVQRAIEQGKLTKVGKGVKLSLEDIGL